MCALPELFPETFIFMYAMNSKHSNYHSYLLRLWQVHGNEGFGWRASLEDVQTGEMIGFQDLAALVSYLEDQDFTEREEVVVLEPR